MSRTNNPLLSALSAVVLLSLAAVAVAPASEQRQGGNAMAERWMNEAQERIESLRRVPVRVIVLDASGNPVEGAEVHLRMEQHHFKWGVRLHPEAVAPKSEHPPDVSADHPEGAGHPGHPAHPGVPGDDGPIYRLLNAVSLEAFTAWPKLEPEPEQVQREPLDRAISLARQRGLHMRFGPVVHADVARLPDWAVPLEGRAFAPAAKRHLQRIARHDAVAGVEIDLQAGLPGDNVLTDRLGWGGLSQFAELARAEAPRAHWTVRYSDCLSGQRLVAMHRHVTALNEAFAPIDGVAIAARLTGRVHPEALGRAMQWLAALRMPVTFVDLEVAGPDEQAAAKNMRTVLMTLFAEPAVRGVYLRGVGGDDPADTAALLDEEGEPTPAGRIFQQLVGDKWWTDLKRTSDGLGNVQARIYAGRYSIEAKLPDGTETRMQVLVEPSDRQRVIVLRPVK